MDFSTGMNYFQNQIHHLKTLGYASENRFSVQGLDSPEIVFKVVLKLGPGDVTRSVSYGVGVILPMQHERQIESLHRETAFTIDS